MKVTSLYSFESNGNINYLGLTGKDKNNAPIINEKDIAFSPNKDGYKDKVGTILYMLRGAKNLKAEIVDKKTGKTLRKVYDKNNIIKNNLEDFNDESKGSITILNNGTWDGTIYNTSTGKYETAPEGEYIYRISSSVDPSNNKEQVIDLPVKLDLTAPTVKLLNVIKNKDESGSSTYELQWKAEDSFSSIDSTVFIYNVNGTSYSLSGNNVKYEDGIYKANITFPEGSKNEVSIMAQDYAGNVSSDTKDISADEVKGINLFNLKDGNIYNEKDVENGKFVIKGSIGSDVSDLSINGKNVNFKDNTLSYALDVTEGSKALNIIAHDKDGKEVYNESFNVKFDFTAPLLTVTSPSISEDEIFVTEEDSIVIKGTIKEDNLNEFYAEYDTPEVDEDGNYTCEVNGLQSGLNKISVIATDLAGHMSKKNINVLYKTSDDPFKIFFNNLTSYTVIPSSAVKDGVYTIKGTVNHLPKTFKINDTDVVIKDDMSFTQDIKLNEGVNKVTLYAEDDDENSNNIVYDYAYKILYDSKAPKINISEPTLKGDGKVYTNKDSIKVKGTASDNFYGYTLNIDGDQVINTGDSPVVDEKLLTKSFEKSIDLKEGENKIAVNAVDMFGNKADLEIPVVLDKTAPIVTVSGVEDGKAYNTSVTPAAVSNKDGNVYMTINDKVFDGKPISAEGTYTLKAYATDYAGNISKLTTINFTVDKTAPVISASVVDGKQYNTKVLPNVKTNESSKITMTLNGKAYDGSEITEEGNYSLVINAVDAAGNASTKTINFVIDKTAPVITVLGVTEGQKYDGSLDAPSFNAGNDKLTVTLDGTSYDGKAIVKAGYHTFVATAEDLAGNITVKTISFSINAVLTKDDAKNGEAIGNSSSKNVDVVLKDTQTLSAALLKSLMTVDKEVSITVNAPNGYVSPSIIWTFNTKDIDMSKIKDIDLSMNDVSPNAKVIEKSDKNAQILSFKYHGDLPAPIKLKVKVDPKLIVNGKVFFYYYNEDTKKSELIKGTNEDGSWNVDEDGFAVVTITHCSDYFFSSVSPVTPNSGSLPKTGSFFDTNTMLGLGALFMAFGAVFVLKKKGTVNK